MKKILDGFLTQSRNRTPQSGKPFVFKHGFPMIFNIEIEITIFWDFDLIVEN